MSRAEHSFHFTAAEVAFAASGEADYHESRVGYWQSEYEAAIEIVERTIGATVQRQAVTGGERVEVVVDYGDPTAYRRMQEAYAKIAVHRDEAERFRTDERLYGTQGARIYDLSVEDVHHYRLGGGPREE